MVTFYQPKTNDMFITEHDHIIFPAHLHSAFELLYVVDGEIDVTINNIVHTLKKENFIMILPNEIHSYHTNRFNNKFILVICPLHKLEKIRSLVLGKKAVSPIVAINSENRTIVYDLFELAKLGESPTCILSESIAQVLFIKIIHSLVLIENKPAEDEHIICGAITYMSKNFRERIELQDVANHLFISKYYLSRVLNATLNMGFCHYLNFLRVDHAQYLISTTGMTMMEISLDCGFGYSRSFNRAFKQITGITPSEFQNGLLMKTTVVSNELPPIN